MAEVQGGKGGNVQDMVHDRSWRKDRKSRNTDILRELCLNSVEVGPEVLGQGVIGVLGYLSSGVEVVSFGLGFL